MSPLAHRGRSLARAVAIVAVPVALALAVHSPALAQVAPQPAEVLKQEPYYLGLYEAKGAPKGTILMLHGGGWRGDLGPAADEVMSDYIELAQKWGYDVANLGYRGGADSLTDALDAFDYLRETRGPDAPICLFGGSAGGHLALMVAAERGASVDCVIDVLGPPDLEEWGSKPQSDAGRNLAIEAFGESRLAELSPLNNVDRIVSPVLVAAAPCDVFIEMSAQRDFVEALNAAGGDAQLQALTPGDEISVGHCGVTAPSFFAFSAAAKEVIDRAAAARPEVAPPEEDGGSSLALILAGAVVLVGLAVLVWHLRRERALPR